MNLHASHASPQRSRITRLVGLFTATLTAGILLSACADSDLHTTGNSGDPSAQPQNSTVGKPSDKSDRTKPLKVGEKFKVPCGYQQDDTCMEVEIKNIAELGTADSATSSQCPELEYQPLQPNEKIIYIDLHATMPENVGEDFSSPFRNQPWRAITKAKRISQAPNLFCDVNQTHHDLADEFPGLSADGRFYLKVPESVALLQVKNHELIATIDVSAPGQADGGQNNQSKKRSGAAPNPTTNATPAPVTTAPIEPATETTAPAQPDNRPIGTTKAPGLEAPHPLEKTISSCATDYTLYQRGTTFFTDGTSGWTEECAAAMDAAMGQ